jgi:hypothetical protein
LALASDEAAEPSPPDEELAGSGDGLDEEPPDEPPLDPLLDPLLLDDPPHPLATAASNAPKITPRLMYIVLPRQRADDGPRCARSLHLRGCVSQARSAGSGDGIPLLALLTLSGTDFVCRFLRIWVRFVRYKPTIRQQISERSAPARRRHAAK